jgi:lysophospholipase L1-like esterase
MMNTHRRIFAGRWAGLWLVPLSLLVALLLGEAVLRLFPALLPEAAQMKRLWLLQTSPGKSIADPYLGSVYPPHYRAEIVSLDFRYTIESDENGFRNRSPLPSRADIVVVGDSMAYGYGIAADRAWARLLEEKIPGTSVVDLALPGTGPEQYLRYLERFGLPLRPKLVVFAIFPGNDFADAESFDSWLAAGSPGNYDAWRYFEGDVPNPMAGILRNSYMGLFLGSLRKSLRSRFESMTLQLAGGEKLQLAPTLYEHTLELNDRLRPGFGSVVRATVAARDLARENGSDFLVVLFPTKEAVYLPLQGQQFPTFTRPLQELLEDQGIDCLNLLEPLRASAAGGQKLYFEIDGHPNELGNQLIAEAIAGHLENGGRWAMHGPPPSAEPQANRPTAALRRMAGPGGRRQTHAP